MLKITQHGPADPTGPNIYSAITVEYDRSCASTNEDGTKHTWPYEKSWLILTEDAKPLWKGQTKTEHVVIKDADGNITHEHTHTFGYLV